MQNGKY